MHCITHLCIPGSKDINASRSFIFFVLSNVWRAVRQFLTVCLTCRQFRKICSTVSTVRVLSLFRHLGQNADSSIPTLNRCAACLACPDRSRKSDISSLRLVHTLLRSSCSCSGLQKGLFLKKSRLGASGSALAEILLLRKYFNRVLDRCLKELRSKSRDVSTGAP